LSASEADFKKLSVLIVVDTSSEGIADIHREVAHQLQDLGEKCDLLYLVGTADERVREEIRRILALGSIPVRVLQFALPVSEAAMLSAGAQQAQGDLLVTIPACYETDLSVLPTLVEAVVAGADLAFACRSTGLSSFQSRMFNKAVSLATGSAFHDIASRTRVMRKRVFEEIPLYGDFHRYVPILAERSGFRVREIPADEHPRADTPRLRSPLSYLWRGIDILSVLFISRFTRYPLRLFGGAGAGFAALGGLILLVIGVQRILGTPLANRPILVLATLLLGLGVQAFAIGLLGELLLYFSARRVRDYRITAVFQSDPRPLPPREGPELGLN
jgi:hypothetical protein